MKSMSQIRLRSMMAAVVCVMAAAGIAAAPAKGGPAGVPPHPRLNDLLKAGDGSLPFFMTHPDFAAAKRIDSPKNAGTLGARVGATTINALAVVVDFSDNVSTVTATFFDTLIFEAPKEGRGSVADYFDEISYGQLDIVTVNLPSSLGWQRAPQPYWYYTCTDETRTTCGYGTDLAYPHNAQRLAEDVVDAIQGVVDFSVYDNDENGVMEPIMIVHAGEGAEFSGSAQDIWSHSWEMQSAKTYDGVTISDYVIMPEYFLEVAAEDSDMTIGVFAHEMGHGFWGLPDLYDRDYSSNGVGEWSLMAGGSWNGPETLCPGPCYPDGSSPAWPDAWNRKQMGLVTPAVIGSSTTGLSFPEVVGNAPPTDTVFQLQSPRLAPFEYFLLENRQQTTGSYDEYLPGEGLLIWHVDDSMNSYAIQNDYECETFDLYLCNRIFHYLVALEQADGWLDLEAGYSGDSGDPFPGYANRRSWTSATDPGPRSWYTAADTCLGVTNISDSLATMTADISLACPAETLLFLPGLMNGSPSSIINGGFELFTAGWMESSEYERPIIGEWGARGGPAAHGGSFYSWLGGMYNENASIQQSATIFAGRGYMAFWAWRASSESSCINDYATIRVNGAIVYQTALCASTNNYGWTKYVVNLSGYIGQTVTLRFESSTNGTLNSNWFVDDISFQSSSSAASAGSPAAPEYGEDYSDRMKTDVDSQE